MVTCKRVGINPTVSAGDNADPVLRSIGHGLVANSAFLQPDQSYKQVLGQTVCLLFLAGFLSCPYTPLDGESPSWIGYG